VILPSSDSVGRAFPLTLLLIADGALAVPKIDSWCDAALALTPETLSPDALWHAIDALPAPAPDGPATGPMLLWTKGNPPLATAADDPSAALSQLLGPS
jgi:type VI secretion system protein ImpM